MTTTLQPITIDATEQALANIMVRCDLCLSATVYYNDQFRRSELISARDRIDVYYDRAIKALPDSQSTARMHLQAALAVESRLFELPETAALLGLDEVMS